MNLSPTSSCTSEPREIDLNPFRPFHLGVSTRVALVARGHRVARDVSYRASAVGLAERPQVAGSLADEVLARQARWHLRAASRKTASPSAADVFPHCVRFALNLVQLMFDNVADADDAAEPAVLLDYRNVADPPNGHRCHDRAHAVMA